MCHWTSDLTSLNCCFFTRLLWGLNEIIYFFKMSGTMPGIAGVRWGCFWYYLLFSLTSTPCFFISTIAFKVIVFCSFCNLLQIILNQIFLVALKPKHFIRNQMGFGVRQTWLESQFFHLLLAMWPCPPAYFLNGTTGLL